MMCLIVTNAVIAAVALGVGVVVLAGNSRGAANQSFFLFAGGISLSAAAKSLFWGTDVFFFLGFASWGFGLIILGMCCLGFVPSSGRLEQRFLFSLVPWILSFLAIPVLLISASFHSDPAAYFEQGYHALFLLLAFVMGAYLIVFFSTLRREIIVFDLPPLLARGLVWIVAASAFVMFMADIILPLFDIHHFEGASNLFAVFILAIGGYAVARYGAWNGGILLRKGLPYFLSLICVALLFFGIEFGVEKFFYQNDEVVDIFAASVGALVFCPMRLFFDKVTDRFFFRNPSRFLSAVRELGDRLSAPLDRNVLIAAISTFLHVTVRPTEVVFFGVNNDGSCMMLASGFSDAAAVASDYLSLAALFLEQAHGEAIIADTWRLFRTKNISGKDGPSDVLGVSAVRLGVAAIVPVVVRGDVKMIMMVGHKCSGALLCEDDAEFLDFAARRAAIALEILELRGLMERQTEKFKARVAARTERLKNMYESQSRFLADVSHEFKTPLAILKMHASAFSASENVEQKKAWYVMDATLDRLTRLVGHLSDASRLDSPQEILRKECIPAEELLRDAYDDCMVLAEDKGVALSFESEKTFLFGEKDKLKEVILNLISNALRHTPPGGSISLAAHDIDGETEITVRDTGSGISREYLPHIFERFYRIEEGGFAGTGIGLYLCRKIIERHGGTITAESHVGKGSCFAVRLPPMSRDT